MTKLQPVSFSTRQAPQPRLSPPRVFGRQHERFWKPEEDQLLRENYEAKGAPWCASKLPNRSLPAIYSRAEKLGLRTHVNEKRELSAELDQLIIDRWPTLSARGDLQRFADEINQPRWWISKCAARLGLTRPRRKEPVWSAAEDELLRKVPLHDPKRSAQMFAERGFHRTPTAIVIRSKRQGLSRRYKDTLSATSAAAILGVNAKWISARCIDGTLAATRRGTQRLVQQGGDSWSIEPADLRRFILDNLEIVDIRKVEKFSFVALLVGAAEQLEAQ